jgi:peptidoglycan/xylan/chitin deacetylase (PgdA/CDA1 family)
MRVPGKSIVKHLRWLRSRVRPGFVVLGYHRIASGKDPFELAVAPVRFEEQMAVLARETTPLPLHDAVAALARGTLPSRGVALTFDDGYADNLHIALPVLERHAVPATFFIATAYLGNEFWWDEIERLLSGDDGTPRSADGNDTHARGGHPSRGPAVERREVHRIADRLRVLTGPERAHVLDELRSKHASQAGTRPAHPALTSAELVSLAGSRLVTIGAHSRTHPRLAALTVTEQEAEVRGSRADLQAITGTAVTSFSYPNGSLSPETLSVVRDAGFTIGCSSRQDLAMAASDPLALPRFWARDIGGREFARWIGRWLHD